MCLYIETTLNDRNNIFKKYQDVVLTSIQNICLPIDNESASLQKEGEKYLDTKNVNEQFRNLIPEREWKQEIYFGLERFDFFNFKEGIRLEIQFGADVSAFTNVHHSDLYYQNPHRYNISTLLKTIVINGLILIVRCKKIPCDSRVVSYEWLKGMIGEHIEGRKLSIPIWLIGLYG